jgi:hypothetical protein
MYVIISKPNDTSAWIPLVSSQPMIKTILKLLLLVGFLPVMELCLVVWVVLWRTGTTLMLGPATQRDVLFLQKLDALLTSFILPKFVRSRCPLVLSLAPLAVVVLRLLSMTRF